MQFKILIVVLIIIIGFGLELNKNDIRSLGAILPQHDKMILNSKEREAPRTEIFRELFCFGALATFINWRVGERRVNTLEHC